MTALTPEAFMTQTDPEDDLDTLAPETRDPLESIAHSLGLLASLAVRRDNADTADGELQQRYAELDQAHADLEDKHRSLFELLAEVEKIVMPSTSKLANSVREAITRWRNPEVPEQAETADTSDEGMANRLVPPAVQCTACLRYFADQALLDQHACTAEASEAPPAQDADVDTWRAYARRVHGVDAGTAIDGMNRSQIRTMLGVEQPVTTGA